MLLTGLTAIHTSTVCSVGSLQKMTKKETIEHLQRDILGPRYKDKRTWMDLELAVQPQTIAWYGVLEFYPIWKKNDD